MYFLQNQVILLIGVVWATPCRNETHYLLFMQLNTLLTYCCSNTLNTFCHDLLLVLVLFLFSVHLSTVLLDLLQRIIRQFPLLKKSITLMYDGQHIPGSTLCIRRHFGWWIVAIMNAWAENSLLWTAGIQPLCLLLQKERFVPWDSQLPSLVSEQGIPWAATLPCFSFHKRESKITFKNVGNKS